MTCKLISHARLQQALLCVLFWRVTKVGSVDKCESARRILVSGEIESNWKLEKLMN